MTGMILLQMTILHLIKSKTFNEKENEKMIKKVALPTIIPDPYAWFNASDEQLEEFEKIDNEKLDRWKSVILSPFFRALQFIKANGNTIILSPSTEPDQYDWRISYFDDRGAIMHEEFSYSEKNDKDHSFLSMLRSLAVMLPENEPVEIIEEQ